MGKISNLKPFLEEYISKKSLILKMLKYEDSLILGDIGKQIFENNTYELFSNLETTYIFHRLTLNEFQFSSNDDDVINYRKIFGHYYKSPTEYDHDIINSVAYMRENKCIYYTEPELKKEDFIPNIDLYKLDGITKTSLHNEINKDNKYTIIGAFSNS
jgi:hypothetical protein